MFCQYCPDRTVFALTHLACGQVDETIGSVGWACVTHLSFCFE